MQDPLVSIKMITYNHEPHIEQAIKGVLSQRTNFAFELVIGEDCSIDGTRQIVLDYQRKYPNNIQVITSDKNVGSRKNGIRTALACKGKYLALCEGDDYWHNPEKLQKQVNYMESHPECGLTCSDFDMHYTKSGIVKHSILSATKKTFQSPQLLDIVDHQVEIRTCTVLLRKSLHDQVKAADPYLHQNDNFKMGDTQLWAEMSLVADIHFIADSLATYNILEESATQSKDIKKVLQFWISSHKMVLYLCKKYSLPDSVEEKYELFLRRKTFQLAFYENRLDLALEARNKYDPLPFRDAVFYLATKYKILKPFGHLLNWTINTKRSLL